MAGLAFQGYFGWIERAKAAEAIGQLKSLKDQIEPCLMARSEPEQQSACIFTIVTGVASENFTYEVNINPEEYTNYSIHAVRKNTDPFGAGNTPQCGNALSTAWFEELYRGVTLCREQGGKISIIGFGMYQGNF